MIVRQYSCPRCRHRWPGLFRIIGWSSFLVATFLAGVGFGWNAAVYWGDPKLMAQAAALRVGEWVTYKTPQE